MSAQIHGINMTSRNTSASVDAPLPFVERPRYGRWLGAVAILFGMAWVVFQLITNDGFQWPIVLNYVFNAQVLQGVGMTLLLTTIVMLLAFSLGIVVALMRLSGNPIMTSVATLYIWFFRGTPTLVQLIFWFNLATLFDKFSLGIPFGGPKVFEQPVNTVITSFVAAILGLGLNEVAYMSEFIRGGIVSVPKGQWEAARSIGFTQRMTIFKVILPQAMRSIVPATGNQTIGMLKWTSLAIVVSLHELLFSVQTIYSRTFEVIPLLIVASLWYLAITSVLQELQRHVERHYSRGEHSTRAKRGLRLSTQVPDANGKSPAGTGAA